MYLFISIVPRYKWRQDQRTLEFVLRSSHLKHFCKNSFPMKASLHSVVSSCSNSKLSLDDDCDPLWLEKQSVLTDGSNPGICFLCRAAVWSLAAPSPQVGPLQNCYSQQSLPSVATLRTHPQAPNLPDGSFPEAWVSLLSPCCELALCQVADSVRISCVKKINHWSSKCGTPPTTHIAASASPGNLLDMQILGLPLRPPDQESVFS